MEGEADIAVIALWHPSARGALYHRRKAAAVLEEDGLTALVQGLADSREQPWREGSVHHLAAAQLLDVDDLHLRQFYILIALRQTYIAVLSSSGILV